MPLSNRLLRGGVHGALEAHLRAVQEALGLTWSGGPKIDYVKFRSAAELTASGLCPFAGAACATGGRVFAAVLLALSVMSASYPTWNPWTHPWLYNFLHSLGVAV